MAALNLDHSSVLTGSTDFNTLPDNFGDTDNGPNQVRLPTTATPLMDPVFSSNTRAERSVTFSIPELGASVRGHLTGRRPAHGLKFPRGYYNK